MPTGHVQDGVKHKRKTRRKIFTRRRLGVLLIASVTLFVAYSGFEARVAADYEDIQASSPTRILARPLTLRPGDRVDRERVAAYLKKVGYRSVSRRTPESGEFQLRSREWRVGRRPLRIGEFFDPGGPTRIRLDRYGRISSIRDEDDRELSGLLLDPEVIGTALGERNRDRIDVALDQLPRHLIDALLSVEDRRFFEHGALDPRRIAGAALSNFRQGRLAEGGSTLTQQLARTLFLSTDRTVFRKVREAAIAFALERRFSKEHLLESYSNHIYLGQDGASAIHGFGRAAQFFYDRDVSELTVGQSAMLVGIIRGPSMYAPHRHPDRARARRDVVLRQLHQQGHLDSDRLEEELEADLDIREPRTTRVDARWYLDFLRRELAAADEPVPFDGSGLTIVSSLDLEMQRSAERALREGIGRLERLRPRLTKQLQPLQAALVAIDPRTGEIVAMVGGRSYGASQFNRAADARRQPGSAFKPIVALAAISGESSTPFTLASVLQDVPLVLETPAGVWAPSNADHEFLGPVRLREALEGSRNVPFARLGLAIGPERIVETAERLGIRSPLTAVPSLALGASEVTLLELTSAYGVLAVEGERIAPHAVRTVLDLSGATVHRGRYRPERVTSPAEAYLLTSALRGVVERGTGRGVVESGYRGPVAAKSGTTNGSRDAWFVGYTPELAVGVWVGFDDGSPVGLSGSQAALPIFADFLRETLGPEGGQSFRFPDGVEWIDIEPETGLRAGWGCRGEPELFLVGTAPESSCGRTFDRRWRDLRRSLGSDLMDELERELRRTQRRRRSVRAGGRSPSW